MEFDWIVLKFGQLQASGHKAKQGELVLELWHAPGVEISKMGVAMVTLLLEGNGVNRSTSVCPCGIERTGRTFESKQLGYGD